MGKIVQVEIKIDTSVTEPKVIILTDKMTEEINEIVRKISGTQSKMIAGFNGDTVTAEPKRHPTNICR